MLSLHSGKWRCGLGARPAPADAALRVDDDALRLDQAGLQQRRQGQDRRGRIAARIGDQRRRADLLAKQLRQAVDRVLEIRSGSACLRPYHWAYTAGSFSR